MQKLTPIELQWTICELNNFAMEYMEMTEKTNNSNEKALLKLRAENLYSVAEKLQAAIDNDNKRISIL